MTDLTDAQRTPLIEMYCIACKAESKAIGTWDPARASYGFAIDLPHTVGCPGINDPKKYVHGTVDYTFRPIDAG